MDSTVVIYSLKKISFHLLKLVKDTTIIKKGVNKEPETIKKGSAKRPQTVKKGVNKNGVAVKDSTIKKEFI